MIYSGNVPHGRDITNTNIVDHVLYRVERTGTLTDIPLASPTSPKAPSGVHSHTHTHTTAFVFVYFVGYCLLLLSCATSICNVCVWLSLATEDDAGVEVRGEGGNGTLKPLAPPRDFGEHTHTPFLAQVHTHTFPLHYNIHQHPHTLTPSHPHTLTQFTTPASSCGVSSSGPCSPRECTTPLDSGRPSSASSFYLSCLSCLAWFSPSRCLMPTRMILLGHSPSRIPV